MGMATLVDTATKQAALPELLHEVHEVVNIVHPGLADKIGVVVEAGVVMEPVSLQVTIKPAPGVFGASPAGIHVLHVATHTLDKQWTFKKELEAVCTCGKPICRTEYLSTLKHSATAHAQEAALMASVTTSGLALNGDGVDTGAQAAKYAACQECCKGWEGYALDMTPEDKMKALAGMIGASIAGYSDPNVYNLGFTEEGAAAFEDMCKAVLEDESLFTLTSFIRPVRPADEESPDWVKSTSNVPLTQWCLSQPWYLQFCASRDHPGVHGADMCLPARRGASRVRSEFEHMDSYDALAYDEQSAVEAPKVTPPQVVEKLAVLLQRTGDWRTPEQFVQRLGISLNQFADLVNLKEIGGLAIDMCCRCGIFVLDAQPAVACEYCVDAYHLNCQGLKVIPDGDWICPGCTLASGATGKVAMQAAALARSKSGARAAREKARNKAAGLASPRGAGASGGGGARPRGRESPSAKPARAAKAGQQVVAPLPPPPAHPTTSGASGGPPQPPPAMAMPSLTAPLPPGARPVQPMALYKQDSYIKSEDTEESDEEMGVPVKRQRTAGGGSSRRSTAPKAPRNAQYRPNPADAQLYVTNVPGMPMPSADGRTLVVRIATSLLNRQVAPVSNRWCAQAVLSMKMLAGINCEYHFTVNTGQAPVILAEATLVHGGVRCNRCRKGAAGPPQPPPAPGEDAMQVDADGQPLAVKLKVEEADTSTLSAFNTCNQVFRRIADFEAHLRHATPSPPSHMWLPKHRLYLKGLDGTKGLMDLATEEANRNPNLAAALATATEIAQEARRRALVEGRDPDASDDDDLLNNLPTAPRGGASRQRSNAAQALGEGGHTQGGGRSQRARATAAPAMVQSPTEHAPEKFAQPKSARGAKREISPALPGFDPVSVAREQARVRAVMHLQLSETTVLAQLPSPAKPSGNGGGHMEVDGVPDGEQVGKLTVLVMVRETGEYALVPQQPLEAALRDNEGQGGPQAEPAGDAQSNNVAAAKLRGIPTIPAALLPALIEAGGKMLKLDLPEDISPPASPAAGPALKEEEGGAPGRPSSRAAESHASDAKVASLKLLRRLSALSAPCSGEASGTAASTLKALKSCREAANQIPDSQLQLESLATVADLVTQLEGIMLKPQPQAGAAPAEAGLAGAAVQDPAPQLTALLSDVRDLQAQLEEWAGAKKP